MKRWLRKPLFLNSCLFFIGGFFAVSCFELALRLSGFDTDRAVRATHPANFRQTRKHLEYQYEFATNSFGLRGPEITRDKPTGVSRILLAGDSFVEGVGVNQEATISAALERRLPAGRFQVINCGLSGTGVFEHGRLARSIGYGLKPDILLYFVFDNDVFDAQLSQKAEDITQTYFPKQSTGALGLVHFLWPRVSTQASQATSNLRRRLGRTDFVTSVVAEAKARGIPDAKIEEWKAKVLPKYGSALEANTIAQPIFSLSLVSPHFWSGSIDLDRPDMQKKFEKMADLMLANIEDARSHEIRAGVVYIPSKFQYDPTSHEPAEPWVFAGADIRERWLTEKTPIRERLEAWASAADVVYLDLTPYYREAVSRGERLTWRLDEHFNPRGNEYTATVIADWLRQSDRLGLAAP